MSQAHEMQAVVFHGNTVSVCRHCKVPSTSEKISEPCSGPPANEQTYVSQVGESRMPGPALADPDAPVQAIVTGPIKPIASVQANTQAVQDERVQDERVQRAIDAIHHLHTAMIENKIDRLMGEIAALEVLLAAAKARDAVKGKAT